MEITLLLTIRPIEITMTTAKDIRTDDHGLFFMYVGMIMHHGISFEKALDELHFRILNADYENDIKGVENNSTKVLEYIEEVLFG